MILGSTKHVHGMCWGGGGGYPHSGFRVSCFEIPKHIRETCFGFCCFELGFLQFTSEFS